MSWYSGNQLTPWVFRLTIDRIICTRLVPTVVVISTPTGGRAEPEVYFAGGMASMSSLTGTNSPPAVGTLDDEDCRLSQARNALGNLQRRFAAVVSMTAGLNREVPYQDARRDPAVRV